MSVNSLSFRALLIASAAIFAPTFANAQEAEQEPQETVADSAEEGLTLQEVVVLGRYIPEVLRSTSEVAAFLAPEDLARQGDSNAALALTRVTGLSIAEGRFIYVRGLGERYSSARLNGSPLPSPEPLQRVVPLDLFPTKILENVLVQKTYSVEYPGEFGGGIIDLRTLNIPRENFLSISASGSYNNETSLQDGITHYGSETDGAGWDNGTRKIPVAVRQAIARGRIDEGNFTQQELQSIGQSFRNAEINLIQSNDELPLNGSYSIKGGRTFDLKGTELGLVGVLGYSNGWQNREGRQQVGDLQDTLVLEQDYEYQQSTQNVGWDALFGMGLDFGNDEINWTNLMVRRTSKLTSIREGDNQLGAGLSRDDRTGWYERELLSSQLSGSHYRGPFTLDWRGSVSTSRRDAPYERVIRYVFDEVVDGFVYDPRSSASFNSTAFSFLDDKVSSAGADIEYVQALSSARDITYSAGVEYLNNERQGSQREFRFLVPNPPLDFLIQQQRPDFLFANYNISPDGFQLRETTAREGAAGYEADLEVSSVYAKVDAEVLPLVRVAFGLRYEDATQTVTPLSIVLNETTPLAPPSLDNQYVLPAATLTWNFAENQQLRLGASQSIGRPQFRELAPQQYFDPESSRIFIGNPYLQDTELLNLDARYEYYFDRGQSATAGVFYKQLDKPVESVVTTQSASTFQTYLNAPQAVIYGTELEFKKVFDSPLSGAFFETKEFLLQANYTYSKSELQVSEGDVVFPLQAGGQSRPASDFVIDGERLQGQSEHLANLQLGWEDEAAKSQATMLVTYASERTTARGPGGQPDFVQEPGTMVDFVYKKGLEIGGREFGFDFKVQNILGTDFNEFQSGNGGFVQVNQYELGTTLSVGLSAEF
ncbi:TonB-dependent receptor [Hyphomonas sp.]|uniref:TonB-dependent receptor domain-containing protein n=1 Tax=Hyphomonas sp. TaxID=87 RepID=UPI001BCA72F1|nr:TonB-dependent receptor [Hyphomonas sp.]